MSHDNLRRRLERLSKRAPRPVAGPECVLILPEEQMGTPAAEKAVAERLARLPDWCALLVLPDNGRVPPPPEAG